MATDQVHVAMNGARSRARVRLPGTRSGLPARRRQLPLVVVGVLLLLGGALAFAETALHLQSREDVLVTTSALGAGQVLSSGDLRPVTMTAGNGLALVPVNKETSIIGRPLAVPVVAGAPLTTNDLGTVAPIAAGSDTVALLLKPGGYPPDLAVGNRVEVVPVAAAGSVAPPSSTAPVTATVLAIAAVPADANGGSIVTLQVASDSADGVASLAAAGEASLVQEGVGS